MSHTTDPTKTHAREHLAGAKRKIREATTAFEHSLRATDPSATRRRALRTLDAANREVCEAIDAINRYNLAQEERAIIMESVNGTE